MDSKRKLKKWFEYDVVYWRRWYKYLKNNPSWVRLAKKMYNRRERRRVKLEIKKLFENEAER